MGGLRQKLLSGLAGLGFAAQIPVGIVQSARAEVAIDNLAVDDFANEKSKDLGKIVVFVDVFDGEGKFVTGLESNPNAFKLFVDDQEIEGTVEVQTFKDANQRLAVALLVAAHQSYSAFDPDSGMPNVLELEKSGFEDFLRKLTTSNMVGVWYYTDDALQKIYSWGNKPDAAADLLSTMVKGGAKKEGKEGEAPKLYAHVQALLDDIANNEQSLPARRVLLLMSDGKDINVGKSSRLEKAIDAIVDAATTTHTKIYPFGFTLDVPEPLVNLGTLASRTKGSYRLIADDKSGDIASSLEAMANELQNQYVVTFTPKNYRGSESLVTVRMEVSPPGLTLMKDTREQVKIAKLPTEIWSWLQYVVYGLGGIAGLFLVIFGIRKIARARANRPVAVATEEGYAGPYKGKLTGTLGPYAGTEFFLTEDLTTIGSMAGNTIVLSEGGASRRHAGIQIQDMRFELADFGSTNGTFVNGAKITKQFLRDGDEIRIGENRLRFTLK